MPRRRPGLFFQVGTVELPQSAEAAEVEQALALVHICRLQLELSREQLQNLGRHPGLDLEPDHPRVPAATAKLGLNRGQKILGIAVDIVEVAVARDAERVMGDDVHAGEERLQVQGDHVLEGHVPGLLAERDEARQDGRDLHPREVLLAPLRVAHGYGQVEGQVRDVRERVAGVDGERSQHWKDLLPEDRVQLAELLLAHLVGADDLDAGLGEGRNDAGVVKAHLPLHEPFDAAADGLELIQRRHPVGRGHRHRRQHLLLQPGHAHLEEVVEVLAEDGEETDPFQKGQAGVFGHGQDALVEVEPGQLPVQESVGVRDRQRA